MLLSSAGKSVTFPDTLQRLEHALATEVLARQDACNKLQELQQFVLSCSQLSADEAKAALDNKAQDLQQTVTVEKKTSKLLEELEKHAKEEWLQELGLGPSDLQMLPSCEPRGDHLFVEPSEAISPLKRCAEARKEMIIGHS